MQNDLVIVNITKACWHNSKIGEIYTHNKVIHLSTVLKKQESNEKGLEFHVQQLKHGLELQMFHSAIVD
jgi:hypothetical protein